MNKLLNRQYIKGIAMICGCSLILSSCSDWNETESLKLNYASLETQNPELYEAYFNSLRAYKESEHKIMIAKFDNKETLPAGQAEHISALPDSIDYVILNNPDNLNEVIAKEISQIREAKKIKTLYSIDYGVIENEYNKSLEEQEETQAKEGETANEDSEDGFISFCSQKMEYYLGLYDKYGYDGINVIYNGVSLIGLPEERKAIVEARQDVFFLPIIKWLDAHKDAVLSVEGKPQNIKLDIALLDKTVFITIPTTDAESVDELRNKIEMSMAPQIPTDRFVVSVKMPSLDEKNKKDGFFVETDNEGNPLYAVKGAAMFVFSNEERYEKIGLCVEQPQNDYYSMPEYKNIKEAINIMNPSF